MGTNLKAVVWDRTVLPATRHRWTRPAKLAAAGWHPISRSTHSECIWKAELTLEVGHMPR